MLQPKNGLGGRLGGVIGWLVVVAGGRDACTTESYLYEMESSLIVVKYIAYLQFNITVR